ncbi:MAG TPA: sigma-70 family RNA polymerase sigma factor [Candidatus Limnocylindrales bacterium]
MESPNLTERLMRRPRLQGVITDRAFSIGETVALGDSEVGNERALQLLYQRRSQEMFGFARRLGLADEDASDAVQETMLRLWRELDSGTDVVDPDAWAFRVLYGLAVDNHRLRGRLRGLAERLRAPRLAGDPGRLDGDPAGRIEVDAVWQAIDRLPERQRVVLYLRFRADLPYERIGLALSISAGAARGHASTGLASLRRRLTQEDRP